MTPAQRAAVLRRRPSLDAQVQAALVGKKAVMLDMTDLSTLYQDTAGTTPVTTIGQSIARVNDKSASANHATQSTAGLRPLLQTNNGKYAAQFDGTNDALILPNISWTGGALNSFVALNIGASIKGVHIWRTADGVSGYWGAWESGVGISPTAGAVGSPTYAVNGVAVSPSTRARLYTMMNSQNTVLESIGVTLSANSALQIGGYGLPYALSGPVHRVLLVEGTLTAPQIALFRTWTGQGIGLNL